MPSKPKLALAVARNFILSKKMNRAWKDAAVLELNETDFFEQQILIAVEQLNNFEWLHKEGPVDKCLIDHFRIGLTRYYGPDERLCNVTATEFEHADMFYLEFMSSKEARFLDLFIATLWRESEFFHHGADKRIPFCEFRLEHRAKKVAKLPQQIKNACLINYLGMRKAFIESPGAAVIFKEQKNSGSKEATNWGTILLRLAEKQVFGTYQQTKVSFIHDIVDYMADLKIQEQQKPSANVS